MKARSTLTEGPLCDPRFGMRPPARYIRKVERVNGELQNTVIDTFPKVSQFWKYPPAEYLRDPLYAR